MKKLLAAALSAAFLLLCACTPGAANSPTTSSDPVLNIAATTWPVYCLTTAVTGDLEGVEVTPVLNVQTSCLHDYTLTVDDMKVLEGADVIVLNGVGLEDFMDDALAGSEAEVIDASVTIELLTLPDGSEDPHIWMDPDRAAMMVQNITDGLKKIDPAHAFIPFSMSLYWLLFLLPTRPPVKYVDEFIITVVLPSFLSVNQLLFSVYLQATVVPGAHQALVVTFLAHKLVMAAPLDNLTLFHDDDLIAVTDGGQPMSHHNTGAAPPLDVVQNLFLRLRVQSGSGLIQH